MTPVEKHLGSEDSSGQCRQLADVLTATRQMLEHAGAGEWDQVTDLERARREQLEQCFSDSIAPQHSELVSEALAVMLHLNEELMSLLTAAREAVLDEGVQQARRRSALGSYQDVQGAPG